MRKSKAEIAAMVAVMLVLAFLFGLVEHTRRDMGGRHAEDTIYWVPGEEPVPLWSLATRAFLEAFLP